MSTEARRIGIIRRVVGELESRSAVITQAFHGIEALDDCAVIGIGDMDLIIGSDFVRGTRFHLFELGVISWQDIGWYLMVANASDLAAMGATPLGATLILRYTPELKDEEFEAMVRGAALACQKYRMPLVGGDTGGFNECVLSATAFGICPRGTALMRGGGSSGERIFVTGAVGRAGAAIAYFRRGKPDGITLAREIEEDLAQSWRGVSAAVDVGIALRDHGLSRCAIDTSDGLKASVRQLAEASGLNVVLDAEAIPIDSVARIVAERMGVDPLALAVGDSVDFRLVFSGVPEKRAELDEEFRRRKWPLFEIGAFEEADGSPRAVMSYEGQRRDLPGVEWSQSESLAIDELRGKRPGEGT